MDGAGRACALEESRRRAAQAKLCDLSRGK